VGQSFSRKSTLDGKTIRTHYLFLRWVALATAAKSKVILVNGVRRCNVLKEGDLWGILSA
jgi:hypothetical protein